jgi:hypothetical protein
MGLLEIWQPFWCIDTYQRGKKVEWMNRRRATWVFWIGVGIVVLFIAKEVGFPWPDFGRGDYIMQVKYVYMLIFMSFIAIGAFVIYYIIRKM